MDDKTKVNLFILDGGKNYRSKKFRDEMDKMDKLPETEKSIQKLIKNNNEVVTYDIQDKSISLVFYDGVEAMEIEFYIDKIGNIHARLV